LCPARCWWLTPVILTTWEAEIRRIKVQASLGQIVLETLSQKHPTQKRAGGVSQVVEWLPSNREALSSNRTAVKKKHLLKGYTLFITAVIN
jgi:hypothetical protein